MKIAGQNNNLGGQILYITVVPVKKQLLFGMIPKNWIMAKIGTLKFPDLLEIQLEIQVWL